jgi:hypothetical protein
MSAPVATTDDILQNALSTSSTMLLYAANSKTVVPPELIESLVRSQENLRSGQSDVDTQIKFWQSFSELTSRIYPVTAISLAAGWDYNNGGGISHEARGAVIELRSWAIFFLVVLVITQIIWLNGSSLVQNIDDARTKLYTVSEQINKIQIARSQASSPKPADTAAAAAATAPEAPLLNQKIGYLSQIKATTSLLTTWDDKWYSFHLKAIILPDYPDIKDADIISVSYGEEDRAHVVLRSLDLYILPLLYGVLGAAAYVLRRLGEVISSFTYTRLSRQRFRLRLILGAVVGPVVGLFFGAESSPSAVAALPPIALAFLAGYGTEVLFATLDRLIRAVQDATAGQPKDAGPASNASPTGDTALKPDGTAPASSVGVTSQR